jgi:hypothetical protein
MPKRQAAPASPAGANDQPYRLGFRAARFAEEAVRRAPPLAAFAILLVRRFPAALFLVLRAPVLLFRTSFLPSRWTVSAIRVGLSAFCAASAFAAMLPSADPIDSATLTKSASLPVRAFISRLLS